MDLVLWSLGLRVQPRDAIPLMYLSTTVLCPVMLYAVPLSCSALGTTRPGRSYIGISGPADLREVKPSTILGSQDLEVSKWSIEGQDSCEHSVPMTGWAFRPCPRMSHTTVPAAALLSTTCSMYSHTSVVAMAS